MVSVFDAGGQRVATQIAGALTNVMVYDAMGRLVAEYGTTSAMAGMQYIFNDHQGTPRTVTSSSGAIISRHDYLPFGDELGTIGMRTAGQGYGASDAVRQKYAGMEADEYTNMAHTLWRQYDSSSGRWTAPDPYGGSMSVADPQSFNRYAYVNNNPINAVDPLGLMLSDIGVYQTGDAGIAMQVQAKSDADWKKSINASYAREREGTVSYDANGRATFRSATQNRSQAWLNRGINAAINKATGILGTIDNAAADDDIDVISTNIFAYTIEILIFRPFYSFNPLRQFQHYDSVFGHVAYVIDGLVYTWQLNGWATPPPSKAAYLKDNTFRFATGYVLDFGAENDRFKDLIKKAYDGYHGWNVPGVGEYRLRQNNCGEAFSRAMKIMGHYGWGDGMSPADHERFIRSRLIPANVVKAIRTYP